MNYLLWKTQVLTLIESQEVADFITGKMAIPSSQANLTSGAKSLDFSHGFALIDL